jgi:hypothetical protein
MMPELRAEVLGGREAIRSLSKLPKELRNETRRNIRRAAAPIKAQAQANIPAAATSRWRNWQGGRLSWDAGAARKGIGINVGGGRQTDEMWRIVTIAQRNAAGAVFEVAGRRNKNGNSRRGAAFIAALNKKAPTSRALWRAVDSNKALIDSSVRDAVNAAIRTVNNELG